jgi:hypothetical protein
MRAKLVRRRSRWTWSDGSAPLFMAEPVAHCPIFTADAVDLGNESSANQSDRERFWQPAVEASTGSVRRCSISAHRRAKAVARTPDFGAFPGGTVLALVLLEIERYWWATFFRAFSTCNGSLGFRPDKVTGPRAVDLPRRLHGGTKAREIWFVATNVSRAPSANHKRNSS